MKGRIESSARRVKSHWYVVMLAVAWLVNVQAARAQSQQEQFLVVLMGEDANHFLGYWSGDSFCSVTVFPQRATATPLTTADTAGKVVPVVVNHVSGLWTPFDWGAPLRVDPSWQTAADSPSLAWSEGLPMRTVAAAQWEPTPLDLRAIEAAFQVDSLFPDLPPLVPPPPGAESDATRIGDQTLQVVYYSTGPIVVASAARFYVDGEEPLGDYLVLFDPVLDSVVHSNFGWRNGRPNGRSISMRPLGFFEIAGFNQPLILIRRDYEWEDFGWALIDARNGEVLLATYLPRSWDRVALSHEGCG